MIYNYSNDTQLNPVEFTLLKNTDERLRYIECVQRNQQQQQTLSECVNNNCVDTTGYGNTQEHMIHTRACVCIRNTRMYVYMRDFIHIKY